MYLDYFSLKRHPFRITPDPSLFFPGGAHGRGVVLDALVYAITSGEGILKVVGEVGSGKTMLCRMLEERLPANVEIVYLANPNLSARDIIYAIAFELKLEVDAATDRLVVMHKLQNYLLQRHSLGVNVVVFIEEAQSMPLETLEEVRLLSNLETHRHKLMQIVLFGQPELDRKLQDKSIRQLRERITHSFNLEPLRADEVREYLHFRLQTAGCPWPQLFSPGSEKMLARASAGLTRRINILADKALLASYADPSVRPEPRSPSGEILPMVLPRHVRTAIADSAYGSRLIEKYLPWSGYAVAVVAVSALIFVLFKYVWTGEPNGFSENSDAASASGSGMAEVQSVAALEAEVESVAGSGELQLPDEVRPPALDAESVTTGDVPLPIEPEQPGEPLSSTGIVIDEGTQTVATQPRPAFAQGGVAVIDPIVEDQLAQTASAGGDDKRDAFAETGTTLRGSATDTGLVTASVEATAANSLAAAQQKPSFGFTGLAATRVQPSVDWLASLSSKIGYTIQIFSVLTREPEKLQEFLVILESHMMLDQVFLCVISGNDSRSEQWLVLYNEFSKLSEAQKLIESFPADLSQYAPYTRNLNDIGCADSKS